MSLFLDLKRWLTVWVLTFAFNFPRPDYPRKAVKLLQLFWYRTRTDWIHRDETYGYWIAEDLKKNAKKEAIQDRISEANVILLWIPGICVRKREQVERYTNVNLGGGFRFDLGPLYTPTFATWIRALEADKGIKSMIFVANYSEFIRGFFFLDRNNQHSCSK